MGATGGYWLLLLRRATATPRATADPASTASSAGHRGLRGQLPPAPVPVAVPVGECLTVVEATRSVLTDTGRLNTPMGAAAMVLAQRIDTGEQSGSALSSMVKQLSAALAEATANAKTEMNPVDELRAKRDRKRA